MIVEGEEEEEEDWEVRVLLLLLLLLVLGSLLSASDCDASRTVVFDRIGTRVFFLEEWVVGSLDKALEEEL